MFAAMFHLNAITLFANSPSTFTLAAIGGGCLLGYQILRRKPALAAVSSPLSLESTEAPTSDLAPMPVSFIMQNARVPELSSDVLAAEWHDAAAA
jgi:hypothetical protein